MDGWDNANLMSTETQHRLIELRKNLQGKIEEVLDGQPVKDIKLCFDTRTVVLSSLVSLLQRIKTENLIQDGAKSLQAGTPHKTGVIYTVDDYVFEVKKAAPGVNENERYFGQIARSPGGLIVSFEIDTKMTAKY